MESVKMTGAMSVVGTVVLYGGITLGVITLVFMVYIALKGSVRKAAKQEIKEDYSKIKEKTAGTTSKIKAWRRARLEKKLAKLNK